MATVGGCDFRVLSAGGTSGDVGAEPGPAEGTEWSFLLAEARCFCFPVSQGFPLVPTLSSATSDPSLVAHLIICDCFFSSVRAFKLGQDQLTLLLCEDCYREDPKSNHSYQNEETGNEVKDDFRAL